jgi:O-antigen/teichoic acid export membrane protein
VNRDRPDLSPRSLRRNFSSAFAGNVAYTACQFGMLLVLAHTTTVTEVGRYALALAVASPVFIFGGLKLRQVYAVDAGGVNQPADYFGLRLLTSILAVGVIAAIAVSGLFDPAAARTLLAVGVTKLCEGQIDIYYGAMQRKERLDLVAKSLMGRGVAGLVVFSAALALAERVDVAASALAGLTGLYALVDARRVRAMGISVRPCFDWGTLWHLGRLALPLGLAVAVGSLIVNVPRYVLESELDSAALGVFAVLAYAFAATSTVANALVESAMPRLANLYNARAFPAFKRTLWRLIQLGALLGTGGVVLASLVGKPVLTAVLGPQFGEAGGVLILLSVAAAIQYVAVFLGTAVNAIRLFNVQALINITALVVVAAVAIVAIPHLALKGAGVAVIAGEGVQLIWYLYLLSRSVLPRLR